MYPHLPAEIARCSAYRPTLCHVLLLAFPRDEEDDDEDELNRIEIHWIKSFVCEINYSYLKQYLENLDGLPYIIYRLARLSDIKVFNADTT